MVTITFNATSKEVGCSAVKTDDAVVIPSIMMHGNFSGDWANTEEFVRAADNLTASLTLSLGAGDYEFGMRIGGAANWTANGVAFSRADNAHAITAGSGNITLAADVAGAYVFTWTFASNLLTVNYPASEGGEEGGEGGEEGETAYYIKHNWKDGNTAWSIQPMTAAADGTWTYSTIYGGTGCNIGSNSDGSDMAWYPPEVIGGIDSYNEGDNITFVYDPNTKVLYTDGYTPPEPTELVYYLAGSMTNWEVEMIAFVDGKVVVTLPESEEPASFKIVSANNVSQSWYGHYGTMSREDCTDWVFTTADATNCSIVLDATGEYTFAIDLTDGVKVSVTYPVAEGGEEGGEGGETPIVGAPSYFIAGSMTDWATNMVAFEDGRATLTLAVETYEFKIVKVVGTGQTWLTDENAGTMTRENCTDWSMVEKEGADTNTKLAADMAGDYVFAIDVTDGVKISVTYPGEAQGLDEVKTPVSAVKVIRNGQVLIQVGDKVFNVLGARVR